MKKVLYVASTFGHLAAFHRPYLRFFQERGYEVTAMAGGTLCELPEVDKLWQVPFEKTMTSTNNFKLVPAMAEQLKREQYDIISVHTALAAFFVRLAVKLAGKGDTVVLNTVHGYLFDGNTSKPKRLLLMAAEKLTAGVTDCVLTMNREDTEIAQRGKLGKQVVQIPGMGIDYDRFAAPKHESDAEKFTLVYAAEFSTRKNQQMLLKSLTLLPEAICLKLLGTGDTLSECRGLAQSLGLAHRVEFMGYTQDVPAVYAAADVCVSASRIEGLPFHIMEAMAAGLPIVASRIKGHEDLIKEGENGYLYPYGDEKAFAGYIRELYEDKALCEKIGANNRRVAAQYGLDTVYPQVTEVLGRFVE